MTWMILLVVGFTAIFGYLYIQISNKVSLETIDKRPMKKFSDLFSGTTGLLLLLLLFGLVIRLLYATQAEGYPADIEAFKRWSEYSYKNGLVDLYSGKTYADYPPGYMYILYLLGGIRTMFSISTQSILYTVLIKLPAIFSDLAIAVILYKFFSDKWNSRLALLVSAICLLNPGMILNSSLWGQTDSFLTLWLLLSLLSMSKGRLSLAALFLAIAVLIKPQGLLFAPILVAAYFVKKDQKTILHSILTGAAVFLLSVLMFLPRYGVSWVMKLYMGTAMQFPYASLNAYNLFTLLGGNFKPDKNILFILSFKVWGYIFLAVVIAYAMMLLIKSKKMQTAALSASVLMCGIFALAPAMHERYLFPAVIYLLLAYGINRDIRLLLIFFIFSATSFLNQVQILLQILVWIPFPAGIDPIVKTICIINLVATAYLFSVAFDIAVRERILTTPAGLYHNIKPIKKNIIVSDEFLGDTQNNTEIMKEKEAVSPLAFDEYPGRTIMSKLDWKLLLGLTLLYTLLALFRLGSLSAPVHQWKPVAQGESVVLDLGRVTNVARSYMYEGLGFGSYYYRYSNSPNGPWKDGVTFEVTDVFKWMSKGTNFKARYVMLSVKNKGAEIKEIALVEAGKTVPISGIKLRSYHTRDKEEGTPKNLLDEQNTFEYAVSFMTGTYFDEIYHARTAYEHLHFVEPYESTHPPLGKVIIALGISIFGMNPFGWRIMGTIVGILMIPVIYIFALRLFRKTEFAFLAAFLMSFDFMHFSQTRIATIDSYVVLFIMLMYYFMYRFHTASDFKEESKVLFASGLFFGLACASKWIGIYGGAGLAILFIFFLVEKARYRSAQGETKWVYVCKTLIGCLLYFIIIPAILYLLSYIPFMLVPGPGHGVKEVITYQAHMFAYHSGLTATHPFSSPWWSWPLVLRPVWLYMGVDLPKGMISSMVTMGNPAVWWAGILAVFGTVFLMFKRNERIMLTVMIAFIFQYLPWMFITRTLFIYHFFSSVPLIILCIVYCFKDRIEKNSSWRKWMYVYMGVVLFLFILFYPVLSGMVIPQTYRDTFLKWFGSWGF